MVRRSHVLLLVFISILFFTTGCSKSRQIKPVTSEADVLKEIVTREQLQKDDYLRQGVCIIIGLHDNIKAGDEKDVTVYLSSERVYEASVQYCAGQSRELSIWLTRLSEPEEARDYGYDKGFYPKISNIRVADTGYYIYHIKAHELPDVTKFGCIDVSSYFCEVSE